MGFARRILFTVGWLAGLAFSSLALAGNVDHAMGTTDVPDAPSRIVILTNEGTEALLSLGITPVGAANSWSGNPWYDHISAAMEGAEPVGQENAVNLELIAAMEPDLIIGNKIRHEKIYSQLSAIAPTVFSERLQGDWMENFELYAEAVGKTREGEAVMQEFKDQVTTTRDALGDATQETVSVVRLYAAQIRIYQKDSFSGVMLDQLGFRRPPNQDVDEFAMRVGKESIPEMDADRIFYFISGDSAEADAVTQEITVNPLWQSLSAVKAGRVHYVSDVIWNNAGGILAAREMLADILRIYDVTPDAG